MKMLLLAGLVAIAASSAQAQMNNADLKWAAAPAGLPSGTKIAVLSGDPGKAGMFTIRLKFPAGFVIAPHHHPTDEMVTVVDGKLSLGMGDTLDKAKAATLTQGGYAVAGANMNHYAFTSGGATVQVTAEGPFMITYVNPKDDPRTAAK